MWASPAASGPRRAVLLAAGVAALALGLVAELASGAGDPAAWVPDLLVGEAFCLSGLLALGSDQARAAAALMVATGVAWFVPDVAPLLAGPAAWLLAHLLYLPVALLVQLCVSLPDGRARTWPAWAAILVGHVSAVLLLWAQDGFVIALAVVVPALGVLDLTRLRGRARRARIAGTVALGTAMAVLGGSALARLVLGEPAVGPARWATELSLAAIAVGLALALRAARWDRATVTDLVVELGARPADRLREELARALADPTLQVGYRVPQPPGWIDGQGRSLVLGDRSDRATTTIDGPDGPLAVLVHDPAVLDDPVLLSGVRVATRLGAANARLTAELRAAVAELEASRRRLLDAGDEERERLEHRLRVGARRSLERLSSTVAEIAAAPPPPTTAERVEAARAELEETLRDLDRLAHGLRPRELDELGLDGALRALAARTPMPVDLDIAPLDGVVDEAVAAAAYYLCAEAVANAVKHARAGRIGVTIRSVEETVLVEAVDDGAGGADPAGSGLRGLTDRIEALGGSLRTLSPTGGGTRLSARIPLRPPVGGEGGGAALQRPRE